MDDGKAQLRLERTAPYGGEIAGTARGLAQARSPGRVCYPRRWRGEIAIRSKKAQALLAILALSAGRPQARSRLTALLWSDRGEAQARSSLRQALTDLRKSLPDFDPPILTTGRDDVALDSDTVAVDAVALDRLIDQGTADALLEAAELYRGDLLDGLDVRDAEFEEWRRAEGERLRAASRRSAWALA